MKKYSYCAEEIQDAATVYRFCNRELTRVAPTSSPNPASSETHIGTVIAIIIGGAFLWYFLAEGSNPFSSSPQSGRVIIPSAPLEPAPVVTKSEYDRVTNGMTLKQVQSIIGAEGEEVSRSEFEGFVTVLYQWGNSNGSSMNAMFQNDRLFTKAQWGLP